MVLTFRLFSHSEKTLLSCIEHGGVRLTVFQIINPALTFQIYKVLNVILIMNVNSN